MPARRSKVSKSKRKAQGAHPSEKKIDWLTRCFHQFISPIFSTNITNIFSVLTIVAVEKEIIFCIWNTSIGIFKYIFCDLVKTKS